MITLRSISLSIIASLVLIAGCSEDSDDETTPSNNPSTSQNQTATLPSSVAGLTANMKFTAAQTGAPYTNDQEVNFTFSANGTMEIDDDPAANDGNEITIATFEKVGSEYIWKDAQTATDYALSLKSDNTINEVNVSRSNNFLGQFIMINGDNTNLVANYPGTYNVSNVSKGVHSRMTVIIDSSGNIDFDTNTQLNSSNYALVSDRLDCCDGIWIDMDPYPSEPYPRVNLFIDSISNLPFKMEYMPEYPNITNRVHIEF